MEGEVTGRGQGQVNGHIVPCHDSMTWLPRFHKRATSELGLRSWTARAGILEVSRVANGVRMNWNLLTAWFPSDEVENRHSP